ncbi:MAG: CPBP family intramembrane metalloprotease [Nitrososphaerota archaeon]
MSSPSPRLSASLALAHFCWLLAFRLDFSLFWYRLGVAASVLLLLSASSLRSRPRPPGPVLLASIALGAASALPLYWLASLSFQVFRPLVEAGARAVYALGSGLPKVPLSLLLAYVGASEEAFWRGYVQSRLASRYSPARALLLTSLLYASIHLWTLNLPLLALALALGLVFGLLFHLSNSLALAASSHALWDELAFVLLPFLPQA